MKGRRPSKAEQEFFASFSDAMSPQQHRAAYRTLVGNAVKELGLAVALGHARPQDRDSIERAVALLRDTLR